MIVPGTTVQVQWYNRILNLWMGFSITFQLYRFFIGYFSFLYNGTSTTVQSKKKLATPNLPVAKYMRKHVKYNTQLSKPTISSSVAEQDRINE